MNDYPEDLDSLLPFHDPTIDMDIYSDDGWDELDDIDHWSPHSWWDSFGAGFFDCTSSIVVQALWQLTFIISLCFLCRLIRFVLQTAVTKQSNYHTLVLCLNHLISVVIGIFLLHHQFDQSCSPIIVLVVCMGLFFFFMKSPRTPFQKVNYWWLTCIVISCAAMPLYCELWMEATNWHRIRGPAMILILKSISYASDLQSSASLSALFHSPCYRLLCWLGYAMCPATLVFGPWFNVVHYEQLLSSIHPETTDSEVLKPFSHLSQLLISVWHALKCLICALFCVIWSTCVCHTIFYGRTNNIWLNAYVASQSFRFSHYFVSYSSEAFVAIYGFGWSSSSPYAFRPIEVTRLLSIELPRSLVDVVVSWNLPMHTWLKQYVYKPMRPFGQFSAILATYTASSLLHGLNFQLSAVLVSIGIFAYIEYVLRERLATILDACVGSRPCSLECNHTNKNNIWVHYYNFGFGMLAAFHLSYLAIMFDTSEEQLQGYSMRHVLIKWADLGFFSHYLAAATYIFYKLIS